MDGIDYNEELMIQQLNTPKPGWFDFANYNWRKLVENPADLADVLGPLGMVALCVQQDVIPAYDNQQKKLDLKIQVVNKSREDLAEKSSQSIPDFEYQSGRDPSQPTVPKINMGDIKPWDQSELDEVASKGIIESIQDLQLSTPIKGFRSSLQAYKKDYLNTHVKNYFDDSYYEDTGLYQTDVTEPQIVTSIKNLENALTNLEHLFKKIEGMDLEGDSLLKNVKDAYAITTLSIEAVKQLASLRHAIDELTPELKEQLKPIIAQIEVLVENDENVLNYQKKNLGAVESLGEVLVDGLSLVAVATDNLDNQLKAQYELRPSESPLNSSQSTEIKYRDLKDKMAGGAKKKLAGLRDMYVAVDNIYTGLVVGGEGVNEAFTEHLVEVQHDIFMEFLIPLSHYEDRMFLESGVLLEPALEHLNNVFESLATELDIAFEDKVKILDQKRLFDTLIEDAKEQKILLYDEYNKATTESEKQEAKVKIDIATSKIDYLQEQRQKRLSYLEQLKEKQQHSEAQMKIIEEQMRIKQAMIDELKDNAQLNVGESEVHKASRQKQIDELTEGTTGHKDEIADQQQQIERIKVDAQRSEEVYAQGLDTDRKVKGRSILSKQIESLVRKSAQAGGFKTDAISEDYQAALQKKLNDLIQSYDDIENNRDLDEFNRGFDQQAADMVQSFNLLSLQKYQYVDEGYKLIHELQSTLKNSEHQTFLQQEKDYLKNKSHSLDEKCERIKTLPDQQTFQNIIQDHKHGFYFLNKFIRLARKIGHVIKVAVKEHNLTAIAKSVVETKDQSDKKAFCKCKALLRHMKERPVQAEDDKPVVTRQDQSYPG